MVITGTVRRVWNNGTKAQIIVSVPHRVLRPAWNANGRLIPGTWVDADKERDDVYCWLNSLRGQLVASLCERAAVSKARVTLTGNETAWGWLVTEATLEPQEKAS